MVEVDPTLTVGGQTMPPHETCFADWAVVAHKDDTGFGRMAADARKVLGFGHHFVIPSERLKGIEAFVFGDNVKICRGVGGRQDAKIVRNVKVQRIGP